MSGAGFPPALLPSPTQGYFHILWRTIQARKPFLTVIHGKSIRPHIVGLAHSLAEPH